MRQDFLCGRELQPRLGSNKAVFLPLFLGSRIIGICHHAQINVYNLIVKNTFIVEKPPQNITYDHFLYCKRNFVLISNEFLLLQPHCRQPVINFLSKDLPTLEMSCKWNHVIYGHLWLASFTEHIYLQGFSMLQQAKYFILWPNNPPLSSSATHWLPIHHSLDVWFASFLGYYEWCYCEHSPIKFWVDIGFHYSWPYV